MDNEDFFNIYVNSLLSKEEQQRAVAHEMTHIERGDFFSDGSLEDVETM